MWPTVLTAPGMNPPESRGPSPEQLRFHPIVLRTRFTAPKPPSPGSLAQMFDRFALPPMLLNPRRKKNGFTSLAVKLPPIVFHLKIQSLASPPFSDTFLSTVIPFSRTSAASVSLTFPLTVIADEAVGSVAHGWPACGCGSPGSSCPSGRQPRARNEPAPAVTLCPTVIVEGALWASSAAPGATLMLPVTLITASGAVWQMPAT